VPPLALLNSRRFASVTENGNRVCRFYLWMFSEVMDVSLLWLALCFDKL